MIFLKVIVTVSVVIVLSSIAERISPRAAGILSGYPLGSAITLFFIGFEQGADFAGHSALYNVPGLTAMLSFLFIYYQTARRVRGSRPASLLAASAAGAAVFFALTALMNHLHLPPAAGILITLAAVPLFGYLFRSIPDTVIDRRVKMDLPALLVRGGLSALIVLAITGAAKVSGPGAAGLFSAFPATTFPLILIVHWTYGAQRAFTVIKNVPSGLLSLVLYSLTLPMVYPRFGIYWGTLIGFAVATVYLLGLGWYNQHTSNWGREKKSHPARA
ncbi:MAG: hypothetical protein GX491_15035 [Chloroflexi bacterium]|nr:hypothetical protein [Chloroflexota bacterium]